MPVRFMINIETESHIVQFFCIIILQYPTKVLQERKLCYIILLLCNSIRMPTKGTSAKPKYNLYREALVVKLFAFRMERKGRDSKY